MTRNIKYCPWCPVGTNGSFGHHNNKHKVAQRKELSEEVLQAMGASRCDKCHDLYSGAHRCDLERYACPICYKSLTLSGLIKYHLPIIHGVKLSYKEFVRKYGYSSDGTPNSMNVNYPPQSFVQPFVEIHSALQEPYPDDYVSPPENAFDSSTERIWTQPSIPSPDDSFYELLSPPENAFDSSTERIWTLADLPNLDEVFPEPRLSEYLPSQYDLSQFHPARFNPTQYHNA